MGFRLLAGMLAALSLSCGIDRSTPGAGAPGDSGSPGLDGGSFDAAPPSDAGQDAAPPPTDTGGGSPDTGAGMDAAVGEDAGPGVDAGVDAGAGGCGTGLEAFAACPFGDAQLVAVGHVSGYDDDDPSMTEDGLELFFNSDRPGGAGSGDIWVVERASTSAPFGAPQPVTAFNTPGRETTPDVSLDGLRMFFSRRQGNDDDIYFSERASRADAWSAPISIAGLSSNSDDRGATDSRARTILVLGRADELYLFMGDGSATVWTSARPISELNTFYGESAPHLGPEALYLVFAHRPGGGDRDLVLSSRASVASSFQPFVFLDSLNTFAEESDPWLSPARDHILFSSDRNGGIDRIYEAFR